MQKLGELARSAVSVVADTGRGHGRRESSRGREKPDLAATTVCFRVRLVLPQRSKMTVFTDLGLGSGEFYAAAA